MGTNYYVKTKTCETCGDTPKQIHLGKNSFGWQFSFQYNKGEYYRNYKEMKDWTKDKDIVNEYNEEISHDEFWRMVDVKQVTENKNHAKYMLNEYPVSSADDEFLIDGYSFSDKEFS